MNGLALGFMVFRCLTCGTEFSVSKERLFVANMCNGVECPGCQRAVVCDLAEYVGPDISENLTAASSATARIG